MVLLDPYPRIGDGITRPREVDRGAQTRDVYRTAQLGVAILPYYLQRGRRLALGARNHARKDGIQQRHRQIVQLRLGIVATRYGSVISSHDIDARGEVVDHHARPLLLEIPMRFDTERNDGDTVNAQAVEIDIGRHLAAVQRRLHRSLAIAVTVDRVAHAHGESHERREVELTQPQGNRIGAATRRHTVEMQHLAVAADREIAYLDTGRVDSYSVGGYTPILAALRYGRREYVHRDATHAALGVAHDLRRKPYDARKQVGRIGEARRQRNAVVLRAAHHRKLGHVERTRIEVLRTEIHRQRIALIGDVQVQFGGQHVVALQIIRLGAQQDAVGRGVEYEIELRSARQLQAVGYGVEQRIDILHGHRQS